MNHHCDLSLKLWSFMRVLGMEFITKDNYFFIPEDGSFNNLAHFINEIIFPQRLCLWTHEENKRKIMINVQKCRDNPAFPNTFNAKCLHVVEQGISSSNLEFTSSQWSEGTVANPFIWKCTLIKLIPKPESSAFNSLYILKSDK